MASGVLRPPDGRNLKKKEEKKEKKKVGQKFFFGFSCFGRRLFCRNKRREPPKGPIDNDHQN
jgi:hypothetical protein